MGGGGRQAGAIMIGLRSPAREEAAEGAAPPAGAAEAGGAGAAGAAAAGAAWAVGKRWRGARFEGMPPIGVLGGDTAWGGLSFPAPRKLGDWRVVCSTWGGGELGEVSWEGRVWGSLCSRVRVQRSEKEGGGRHAVRRRVEGGKAGLGGKRLEWERAASQRPGRGRAVPSPQPSLFRGADMPGGLRLA
jgi:hypothetical protein